MPQIVTAIEIDAPPSVVWNALVDASRYDEWNRFFRILHGRLVKGGFLVAKIDVDGFPLVFDARITRLEEGKVLAWRGPSVKLMQRLASGEHSYELVDLGGGRTRFIHAERFEGALFKIGAIWKKGEPQLNRIYSAFNVTLKARAESLVNRS